MTPEPSFLAIHPPEGVHLPLALTEELREGIVVIDGDSRIRYTNPAMTHIFGYGRDELTGHSLTALMPEEYRPQHEASLEAYLSTGRRHLSWDDVELPGLHRDGSELELRISFTEFTRHGRRFFCGAIRDVTDGDDPEAAERSAERRYRVLFEENVVPVFHAAGDGSIVDANPALVEIAGLDDLDELRGRPLEDLFSVDLSRHALVEDLREGRDVRNLELELRGRDGSDGWVLVEGQWIAPAGAPGAELLVGTAVDISDRKATERELVRTRDALDRTRQKFEGIFDISPVAQAIVDPETDRLLEANRAFERVFGWTRDQVVRGELQGNDVWENPSRRKAIFERARGGGSVRDEEVVFRRRDGSTFDGLFSLDFLTLEDEGYMVGAVQDISHLKDVERELEHRALHDQLTGLPNRSLFWDRLEHALARAQRTGERIAVLFLDLDGFKRVNDAYGHGAGDGALHQLASRVGNVVRDEDTAARLGGDEFGVVLEDLVREEEAYDVADRLLEEVRVPLQIAGEEARFEASCGIAFYRGSPGEDGAGAPEPDELLRQADLAMFAAKDDPGSSWHVFGPDVEGGEPRRLQAEMRLRRGIENGEFVSYYQPIVSLADGRMVAAEALARWNDPERGLVPPGEFIPLAEETGLIVGLGHRLVRRAWRDYARWRTGEITPPDFRLHVNLSGRQLRDPDLVASVGALLQDDDLDPRELAFEITETAAMGRADVMAQLQDLGIRISVDDFGTQYATLDRLTRLDVDSLKVDRAFVARMTDSRRHAAIVEATLALTRALDIAAVAEGIETEEQLRRLRALGCDFGQGFLFAAPVPADRFSAWLEEGRSWPVGS